jgi:LacI family transcriptional regulator
VKKITINEIAKRAGVSKATVSRVINNSKPVSDEIKHKVLEVVQSTNFVPSALGRSLSLKKSHLIGVIIPDLSNPVFSRIIAGMENYIRDKRYSLLITATDFSIETGLRHIQIFNEKSIDGLIFLAGAMNDDLINALTKFHKPVVVIGSDVLNSNITVVEIDNQKAAYEAVKYLVNNGHSDIAMIRGPVSDRYAGDERFLGYKAALEEIGSYRSEWVIEGHYSFDDGYQAMMHLLKEQLRPTAVFCANDLMAVGAVKCTLDHGIKVPDDISFIGFDDVEIARMYNPTITTVWQPFEEKGLRAIEILLELITSPQKIENAKTENHVILKHELVIRQSTRNLKRDGSQNAKNIMHR